MLALGFEFADGEDRFDGTEGGVVVSIHGRHLCFEEVNGGLDCSGGAKVGCVAGVDVDGAFVFLGKPNAGVLIWYPKGDVQFVCDILCGVCNGVGKGMDVCHGVVAGGE